MALSKFEYFAPLSVEEVLELLEMKGENARVMAGGTDLLLKISKGELKPGAVIGLKKIKDLDNISFNKREGLMIGATALLSDVASHPDMLREYPSIAYAASVTANVQIRNMGTVAGNICNAAPSADNAPSLMAMGAEVILRSTKREKKLSLDQFFKGPGLTAIEHGELLTGILIPPPLRHQGLSYHHISARSRVDIAGVCVSAMVRLNEERCEEVRVVLGAVAPTPMRARKTEELLKRKRLNDELIEKAGILASEESKPISDMRASAEYRKKMVAVLTTRALVEATERASKH